MSRWWCLLTLMSTTAAHAGTIYVVRTPDDTLMSFDTRALTFTVIGPLGASFDWGGLGWDPTTSTMYMVAGRGDPSLYTVDLATGRATLVGRHGLTDVFSIAVDPHTGTLYGGQGTQAHGLYELDKRNGSATFVGDPGVTMSGSEWDPLDRGIISNQSFTSNFYLVDPNTGASTFLASGLVVPSDMGLAFDPDTGLFWGFDVAQQVFTFDPNNNYQGTFVMNSGFVIDGASGANTSTFVPGMALRNTNGFCPGTVTFRVSDATPGQDVAFLFSENTGADSVTGGPCRGTRLPLDRARLIRRVRADANGEAEFSGTPNATQCGRIKLIALDLDTCQLSNIQTP